MDRRLAISLPALFGSLAAAGSASAQGSATTDGTPAQFMPKRPADAAAQVNDIEKFPKCPYCGMSRRQFHHARMLVQYSDHLADGTCSLHCGAISLSLNIDREPVAIWVGDNASADEVKPLVDVGKASFLVGSKLPGVMTGNSKVAYGDPAAATAARAANGGEIVKFEQALLAAYTDMAQDVSRIRKNREERRRRAMEQKS